ncbi:hypothetical protein DM860_003511 [Cuscuta australis]|uniref:Photosystem II cytochrome b559 N-terminal domain-containing protein n=1 Tax=Cuscuta australis TaxID=267555 RepID=A0A328DG33_9ASTE|nr:hypothetical protein DM860_003511 [Cuscuta australis]
MTIDRTYPIFTVRWLACSRPSYTYRLLFLGSISAMQFMSFLYFRVS